MNNLRTSLISITFLLLAIFLCNCGSSGETPTPTPTTLKMFFLHHSVGQNLLDQGSVRNTITDYNIEHDTDYELWDHSYNDPGLSNGNGAATGTNYDIPGDNTNTDGLYALWTNIDDDWTYSRNQIMSTTNDYDVIAFKSCFVALEELTSEDVLTQWQNYYLEMRDYFDEHTGKLFVVISPPPLVEGVTTVSAAALAREFADWLSSDTYLGGHTNVVCFNLFNYLAGEDNFLRDDYAASEDDSHPNETANQTVGPIFADFLCDSAGTYF